MMKINNSEIEEVGITAISEDILNKLTIPNKYAHEIAKWTTPTTVIDDLPTSISGVKFNSDEYVSVEKYDKVKKALELVSKELAKTISPKSNHEQLAKDIAKAYLEKVEKEMTKSE